MQNYLVSYDLHKPGRNYQALYDAIKAYPTWAHPLESVWFITSAQSASAIRDDLRQHVDSNDSILVVPVGASWATLSVDKKVTDWMHANL